VESFVLTDGEDSASTRFTKDQARKLTKDIATRAKKMNFQFIQLNGHGGANKDVMNSLKLLGSKLCSRGHASSINTLTVGNAAGQVNQAMRFVTNSILASTQGGGHGAQKSSSAADYSQQNCYKFKR